MVDRGLTVPKSELEKAIERYRADLLANESQATMAIANAYKVSRERMVKRIEALAESIAEDGAEFTASQVLKWQRAKTLLRQVEAEMGSLATASAQPITDAQATAVDLASEQSKGLALATAQSAGADAIAATIATTWNRLNTGAAEAIVGRMSDGSPLSGWLDQFGAKASSLLSESLQSAAALGTNPRAVARELAKQLDISAARLLTMSRTEILGAQRTATLQNYRDNAGIGVTGWRWISAHQTRSCLACLSLDGTVFPLTTEFQPSHVSCRCSSIPEIEGVNRPNRQTGAQWFDAQPEAVKREMIPKGLWDDYQSGKIVLSDFRHLHEDDRWGASYRTATISEAKANAKRRTEGFSDVAPTTRKSKVTSPAYRTFETGGDAEQWRKESFPDATTMYPKSEFDAIGDYQAAGYRSINTVLRDPANARQRLIERELDELPQGPNSQKWAERAADRRLKEIPSLVAKLDSAIARSSIPEDVILWRGSSSKAFTDNPQNIIGMIVRDDGFVSTSLREDVAHRFVSYREEENKSAAMVKIRAPKGTNAIPVDGAMRRKETWEEEMLLSRGSQFRVISVSKRDSVNVVEVEIVG